MSNFKEKEIFLNISYSPQPSGYGGSTGIAYSFDNMTESQYDEFVKGIVQVVNATLHRGKTIGFSDDTID